MKDIEKQAVNLEFDSESLLNSSKNESPMINEEKGKEFF
jgi:hypothetical protein